MGVAALPHGAGLSPEVDRVTGRFGLVDLDAEPTSVAPHVGGVRVFAGHAGWGAGQLEDELAERAWYVVDAVPDDVLTPEPRAAVAAGAAPAGRRPGDRVDVRGGRQPELGRAAVPGSPEHCTLHGPTREN